MDSGELLTQIKKLFKDTIREAKIEQLVEEEVLLSRKEACQLLKINLSTLHRWCKQGIISQYGVSNRVYFLRSELLNQVKDNKIHFYPSKLSA